jgi:hypothetical protein
VLCSYLVGSKEPGKHRWKQRRKHKAVGRKKALRSTFLTQGKNTSEYQRQLVNPVQGNSTDVYSENHTNLNFKISCTCCYQFLSEGLNGVLGTRCHFTKVDRCDILMQEIRD